MASIRNNLLVPPMPLTNMCSGFTPAQWHFFMLLLMEEMAFHVVINVLLVSIQHGYSGLEREIGGWFDVHINNVIHGYFSHPSAVVCLCWSSPSACLTSLILLMLDRASKIFNLAWYKEQSRFTNLRNASSALSLSAEYSPFEKEQRSIRD